MKSIVAPKSGLWVIAGMALIGTVLNSGAAVMVESYNLRHWSVDDSTAPVKLDGARTSNPSFSAPVRDEKLPQFFGSSRISALGVPNLQLRLDNEGDQISVVGQLMLVAQGPAGHIQFRIGLFNRENSTSLKGWSGYFMANAGLQGKTFVYKRKSSDGGLYTSLRDSGRELEGFEGSESDKAFSSGIYNLSLSITRMADGAVQIKWGLTETSGKRYKVSGSYIDKTPATYAFDYVGILGGNTLGAQQINFRSIMVTFSAQEADSEI